ncbi:MAG TPA: BrnA antitoxin family protein [Gemmatimonadales bacterium]|nr:BrnA antitoxin family protein [Gemmatimonadales bacterium]
MSERDSKRESWRPEGADRLEAMSVGELADHLDAMPEEAIDYTEIPPLDDEFFRTAELLLPRRKTAVSLRLDDDVLAWLKSQGPGYQSRINAVLRAYMEVESRRHPRTAEQRADPG